VRIQLFGQHVHLSILGLAVVEAAICFGAPFLAIFLRFLGDISPDTYANFVGGAIIFSLSMLVSMTAMGLYASQQRARTGGTALRLVGAAIVAFLVLAVVVYLFPNVSFGRGVLGWTVLIALAGCFIVRMLFMHTINEDALKRKVLIYGAGKRAEAFMQLRRRTDRRGFIVAGFVSADEDEILVPRDQIIPSSGRTLFNLVRDRGVTEVVVAVDDRRRKFPVEDLLNCRLRGINVIDIVSFLERETGKVRIDMLSPSWLIFSGGFRRDPLREGVERVFDIFVSIVLLALTWPIAVLAWLAIKLEDGWGAPAFYQQERVGLEGKIFTLKKFRSMRIDAEQAGKAAWASENDPRVTRVGRFIRKTRIDELPQLLNVFAGDMCFVGPRPERPQFVDLFCERIPYYRERHWVKPGITGWAQLCYPYGSSERDAKEKLQYDLYYVKHRNLMFDLFILLETAEVILWGRGAR
jgi:sugar transferase (PEP-CTERM system associated)